jgi:hypothetical protein
MTILTSLNLFEISFVLSPANPHCRIIKVTNAPATA